MDSARHVIKDILNPPSLSCIASDDVASTIHRSLDSWIVLATSASAYLTFVH